MIMHNYRVSIFDQGRYYAYEVVLPNASSDTAREIAHDRHKDAVMAPQGRRGRGHYVPWRDITITKYTTSQQEGTTIMDTLDRLRAQQEELNARIRQEEERQARLELVMQERRRRIEQFGDDEWEEGACLRFEKQFTPGGKIYGYVAVKQNGWWYTSGQSAEYKRNWTNLIEFITRDEGAGPGPVNGVWVVSELRPIEAYL